MEIYILLVAVIGLCQGLQYPLEYQYRYFSTIATGIPELSNQASGAALRGDVTVQVHEDGTAMFQFFNVETAQFNGHLGCDLRGDIPGDFAPIEDSAVREMIEEPFEVHLSTNEAIALIVREDELLWISNVRKGIVGVLRNEVIRGNFKEPENYHHEISSLIHEGKLPNSFHLEERTIFGNCIVDYTVQKLPPSVHAHKNSILEKSIEEDVQRDKSDNYTKKSKGKKKSSSKKYSRKSSRKSSKQSKKYPPLSDDLWHVVRTVNFDNCEDSVSSQTAPIGMNDEIHGDQYKWLRGRSSVSELILRGSPGAARIERASVEGATMMSPFGLNTKNVQARTNQTYELVAVREARRPLKLPRDTKIVKTWLMQFYSPEKTPTLNKPQEWLIYTGKGESMGPFQAMGIVDSFNSDKIDEIKQFVFDSISKVSFILTDLDQTTNSQVLELMSLVTYQIRSLSKQDILDLFKRFESRKIYPNEEMNSLLIVDAAASVGTKASIEAVVDIIRRNEIPYSQMLTVAMTITSNVHTPAVIPILMEYAMSIDLKSQPFLGGTVLINFASLVHKLCIDPKATKVTYPGRYFGDNTCDLKHIKTVFVPYLADILADATDETSEWEKVVALKVFGELGTPFAIPIVRDIILRKTSCSKELAIEAIYLLEGTKLRKHTSSHVKEEVMSMMTDVFSNLGEETLVRQAALSVIASWGPKPSFWHRLARTSWREPSRQMASYITTLIEGVATAKSWHFIEQSQAASNALIFAKPVSPTDKYSQIFYSANRAFNRHISRFGKFEWLIEANSPLTLNSYVLIMMNLGGFEMVNFEFILHSDAIYKYVDIIHTARLKKKGQSIKNNIAAQIATEFFNKIRDTVQFANPEERELHGTNIFMRIFEHMKLFLPLNKETLRTLSIYDPSSLGQFAIQMALGYDLTIAKYFNPINALSTHATDIGLPVSAAISTQMLISATSLTTAGSRTRTRDPMEMIAQAEIKSEVLSKFETLSTTGLYSVIPWSKSIVMVDIKSSREITAPFIYTVRTNKKKSDSSEHTFINLDLESYFEKKFPILRASNQPRIGFVPLIPLPPYTGVDIKPIELTSVREYHQKLPQTFTGLQFDYTWKSSLQFPFSMRNFIDIVSETDHMNAFPGLVYALGSPTVEGWSFELNFDPEKSQTKNVSFGFTIGRFWKEKEETTQFGQEDYYTQEADDFSQYSQGQNTFDIDQTLQNSFDDQDFQEFSDGGLVESVPGEQIVYGDNFQKRSEKLKLQYGGTTTSTKSVKVDFVGEEHRSYEILLTKAKTQSTDDKKILKAQIAFFRGPIPGRDSKPLSVCLDLSKSKPLFSPLDTIKSLFDEDLDSQTKLDLSIDCSGEPELSIRGSYHMSDKGKEKLKEQLYESCEYDQNDELKTFHNLAVYDDVKYTVEWKNVCDETRLPLLTKAHDLLEALLAANGLRNPRCESHELSRQLEFTGKRCSCGNTWKIIAKRDDKQLEMNDRKLDPLFDFLYHVGKRSDRDLEDLEDDAYPEHFSILGTESEKCTVGTSHVRTFDGYSYDYKPTTCWTVAYKDCSHQLGAILLVRSTRGESEIPDIRYISEYQQFVIDISGGIVTVNGEEINLSSGSEVVKDEDGKQIVHVYKKNGNLMLKFAHDYYVLVKDNVQIRLPDLQRARTCGICGDFNGEPYGDLVGPQNCPYSDINTFIAAWSAAGETCSTYNIYALRKDVQTFQQSCLDKEAWKPTCPVYNDYCTYYNWKIFADSEKACVSENPIPICDISTTTSETHQDKVIYQCWKLSDCPEVLTNELAKGNTVITKPFQIVEHFLVTRYESISTACKKI